MTAQKDLKKRIRNRQAKTGESYTTARAHVLRARGQDSPGQSPPASITAVVLKCNASSLRIRATGEDGAITLRTSHFDAWRIAPGQFVEVELSKRWQWRDDTYASGTLNRSWSDIPAIGLTPLPLMDHGVSTLADTCEPFTKPDPYAEMWEFLSTVPRREFEFDPIAWGAGVGVVRTTSMHTSSPTQRDSVLIIRTQHEPCSCRPLPQTFGVSTRMSISEICILTSTRKRLLYTTILLCPSAISLWDLISTACCGGRPCTTGHIFAPFTAMGSVCGG